MNKEINILELASELAHRRTKLQLDIKDSVDMYDQTSDDIYYKEDVQDVFNEWYDYYETIITNETKW